MARCTLREALHPTWLARLSGMGLPSDPSPMQIALWQETRHPERGRATWIEEAIKQRAAGVPLHVIGQERGVPQAAVRERTERTVPYLLTPLLEDVSGWQLGREQGRSDKELADLYEVPAHLIQVALDGWPSPPEPDDDTDAAAVAEEVTCLWQQGLELDAIAEQVGVRARLLRRWVAHGQIGLSPRRITIGEMTERYRWSHAVYTLYRDRGLLPAPDSPSTSSRPWWWEQTLFKLEADVLVHRCPVCGGAFATARGRTMHVSRAHGSAGGTTRPAT